MKKVFIYSLLTLCLALYAEAKELQPWQTQLLQNALAPNFLTNLGEDCKNAPTFKPKCSQITDQLCEKLWDKDHRGRMDVFDGVIDFGLSPKSQIANSAIIDLHALADSYARWPEDLKAAGKPIIDELKNLLISENDSKAWHRAYAKNNFDYAQMIESVTDNRLNRAHPELENIKSQDHTFEQRTLYAKEIENINTQILNAKYAEHPNWLRVKRVFDETKKNLLRDIDAADLPADEKDFITRRLESVRLSLPYTDPASIDANLSCSTTEVNAAYYPASHKFTICAGYFNSARSDSALAFVIAHELTHAWDPNQKSNLNFLKDSHIVNSIKDLKDSDSPVYNCDQWKTIATTIRKSNPLQDPQIIDPLQGYYDCLKSTSSLSGYDRKSVAKRVLDLTKQEISAAASSQNFLTLATPQFKNFGKLKKNDFFMSPGKLTASESYGIFKANQQRAPNLYELFTQSLSCAMGDARIQPNEFDRLPIKERQNIFKKAIVETQDIQYALNLDAARHCGRNCSFLVSASLGVDVGENLSDSRSNVAFNRRLENLFGVNSKRNALAAASVLFCQTGVSAESADLAAIEKEFSQEEHPDSRMRRISVFNKINSAAADCVLDPEEKGFSQCDF